MVLHLAVIWRVLLFNNLVKDASAIPNCATKGVIEKAGKVGKLTFIPTANKMPLLFGSPWPNPRMSLLIDMNTLL